MNAFAWFALVLVAWMLDRWFYRVGKSVERVASTTEREGK